MTSRRSGSPSLLALAALLCAGGVLATVVAPQPADAAMRYIDVDGDSTDVVIHATDIVIDDLVPAVDPSLTTTPPATTTPPMVLTSTSVSTLPDTGGDGPETITVASDVGSPRATPAAVTTPEGILPNTGSSRLGRLTAAAAMSLVMGVLVLGVSHARRRTTF